MGILDHVKKKSSYADGDVFLQMIVDNWDVQNENRYEIFKMIFEESRKYPDALHLLACAYACHYSRTDNRKQAIEYFEKYLINPVPSSIVYFSLSTVYSDLGKDYEGEYDFQNAERCYKLSIRNHANRHYSPLTGQYEIIPQEVMLGRMYLKMSTQKAVDYWRGLMDYNEYKIGDANQSGFRRHVDIEYKKALEKHQKGYVYRPRKK